MPTKNHRMSFLATAAALAALCGAQGFAAADSSSANPDYRDQITGACNVRVKILHCVSGAEIMGFDAMSLFGRDGTFQDTNATNPSLRSAAFGEWKKLQGRTYQFAFRMFRFDSTGMYLGSQIVRHQLELAADGASYASSGVAEIYDPFGNLLATGCSSAEAVRLQ